MATQFPKDLKPMKYAEPYDFTHVRQHKEVPFEILYEGEYRGVKFRITNNRGMNPCCYIKIPDSFLWNPKLCGCSKDDWYYKIFDVHGGITWFGKFEPFRGCTNDEEIDCIGWDYGHLGDYSPATGNIGGFGFMGESDHMWSSEELYNDCIYAIDNLLESSTFDA